jgi:pSer/pThr/pTyr-binding forkhead associated (FHA) protein
MPKLVLKFDSALLREVPLGKAPITIGRALDNDLQIDNLAISDHHARITTQDDRLKIEDLNSRNGVFLNGNQVNQEWLHSGDSIGIGKHVILVDLEHDVALFDKAKPKVASPKLEDTYVLDKHHVESALLAARQEADGAAGEELGDDSLTDRPRTPSLIVIKGKVSEQEYLLSSKLTLIGKSPLATLKLKGWFAPKAAAQISKRKDGYYLNALSKRPALVNGRQIASATRLNEGDLIEVGGVSLKFVYRD